MDFPITSFGPCLELGEGPLWHPLRNQLFWFDIPHGILYCSDSSGKELNQWNFNEAASAAGWIDKDTLLIATATGLQKFNIPGGKWVPESPLESDNSQTRSNDGRVAPDGSFWIGTMGYAGESKAGSFYRYKCGVLKKLMSDITIPNATCFSPDGSYAYLADTRRQIIWRWELNEQGDPQGDVHPHIDLRQDGFNPDGAVCDSEGYLWSAHYGSWQIARYAPDGSLDRTIKLPISQPTCPAFGGSDLTTLYITSARQNLSSSALSAEPDAGKVLCLKTDIVGLRENRYICATG